MKQSLKYFILNIFKNYPKQFFIVLILLIIESLVLASSVLAIIPLTDYLLDPELKNPSKITTIAVNALLVFDLNPGYAIFSAIFILINFLRSIFALAIKYSIYKIQFKIVKFHTLNLLKNIFMAKWNFFNNLAPGKLLVQTVYDKNNPNYELLKDNLKILKNENDAQGNKLEIIEMPYLPYFPKLYNNTQYVSPYTNYYVANKSILVPEVDPQLDDKAYKLIQNIYTERTIVPIPAFYQAIGGGGPGCITQQLPKSTNTSV